MGPTMRLTATLVAAAPILSCGVGDGAARDALLARIERVESQMLPAVRVAGDERPSETIWEIMQRYGVPAVSVAVIDDGELEWAKGYGDLEQGGAEVDTSTLFLAGHLSQGLAAVGALRLVASGHIDLGEDVNSRLASWQVPENEFTTVEKVTLRRIMSHSSGLSVPTSLGYGSGEPLPTLSQILDGEPPAGNQPVRVTVTPGSEQRYSLGGYAVLQQLMEDVSGSSYAEFMRETVLAPLGMDRSFHAQPLPESLAPNAAVGHEPSNEVVDGRWRIYPELAALGLWTTPSDLARFVVGVQRSFAGEPDAVLSQLLTEEMLSQQFENRGLGFEVGGEGEWRFFKLEGHGNNYLCDLFAYTSQQSGAIVMTNSSNGEWVKEQVLRAIAVEYGWPNFRPREIDAVSIAEESLAELTGRYSFRGRDRMLEVRDRRIVFTRGGGHDQELFPVAEDLFVERVFGFEYIVTRDAQGAVTGLTLVRDGTPRFMYERVG